MSVAQTIASTQSKIARPPLGAPASHSRDAQGKRDPKHAERRPSRLDTGFAPCRPKRNAGAENSGSDGGSQRWPARRPPRPSQPCQRAQRRRRGDRAGPPAAAQPPPFPGHYRTGQAVSNGSQGEPNQIAAIGSGANTSAEKSRCHSLRPERVPNDAP